jgi:hypothetical protein
MTRQAINYIVGLAGERPSSPDLAAYAATFLRLLPHRQGYGSSNDGGLRQADPKHTAHYTRVAGHRFEGLWR